MDLQAMRSMSGDELRKEEQGVSEQIFRIRFDASLGNQDGVKKLRQLRKQIAQLKTVRRQQVLAVPAYKAENVEAGQ